MGQIVKQEKVRTSELIPYASNAKIHSESQIKKIAASIREFGFLNPVLIDKDKNIIAGHGRVMAADLLKLEEVPCVYIEGLTEAQKKAYILADNRLGELAEWDMELVNSELDILKEMDFDIDLTGFELKIEEPEVKDDDFEIELPQEPKAKPGQVWVLGAHRVMCGDSTDPEQMRILLGGGEADLYLTDPPYGVNYTGKTKDALTIQNDNIDKEQFREFLRKAFDAAKQNMKAGAAFYIWLADSEQYNFQGACKDIGWIVREVLVWVKNTMVFGRQDYQWQHEPCLYGWNNGSHSWYSDRKQTTVLRFDKPQRNGEHPTMKPVPLFDYLIKNSTKAGDIVLDSFGGSGTTIIACEQNNRRGYCMELDPRYVDVIVKRWETFTGQQACLLE